jgi:integrase
MQKTTKSGDGGNEKPKVPEGFPLSWHKATGQFYKRFSGKFVYFGRDPDAALKRYLREKDYLIAGLPVPEECNTLTVRRLCNEFLATKETRTDAGQLTRRTFGELLAICKTLADAFGDRAVSTLGPRDFEKLRASLATGSPVILKNKLIRVRSVFKFADENGLVERPVTFGTGLDLPTKPELRRHRGKQPKPLFTAEEVRAFLDASEGQTRAFILLGINAGLYASDLAEMRHRNIEGDWLDYPRPKSGIARRVWLWSETIAAIKAASEAGKPGELVFTTKTGLPLLVQTKEGGRVDKVANAFARLKRTMGFSRECAGFKNLRHTLRTVVDAAGDQPAAGLMMGHTDASIA